MKGLLRAALVLGLFGAVPAAVPEQGAQILDEAFLKAFRARDPDKIAALYAPDAVMFPPDKLIVRGREAIRGLFADLLGDNIVKDAHFEATHYETSADLSVGWGRFSFTLIPKGAGSTAILAGQFTVVAKKVGRKWLYLSDHAALAPPSPPAQPKR